MNTVAKLNNSPVRTKPPLEGYREPHPASKHPIYDHIRGYRFLHPPSLSDLNRKIDTVINGVNDLGIWRADGLPTWYNGKYWEVLRQDDFLSVLSIVAHRIGIGLDEVKNHRFIKYLLNHFEYCVPKIIDPPESGLVNLKNGVLRVTGGLEGHSPDHGFRYCLPFEYDPKATCPGWEKFLAEVLPENESRLLLQEYAGYCLTKGKGAEIILYLYGSGQNGKSTVLDILELVFGKENVSHVEAGQLTDTGARYLAMIEGKLVNISGETSTTVLNSNVLKSLASSEPVVANPKNKDPRLISDLPRFIIAANDFPKITESTTAVYRRFIFLHFDQYINNPDRTLPSKLSKELPGILNWIIEGLRRYLDNAQFTYSPNSAEVLNEFAQECTVRRFVHDKALINDKERKVHKMDIKQIYEDYRLYCNDEGQPPKKKNNVGRILKQLGFEKNKGNGGNYWYCAYPSELENPF